VQVEHVWVKAFVDYIPSRGAVHKQGDTWIPLDASYKQYTYIQGIDISAAVPFDAQSFANQILSTATTNTAEGSVTNVNSALIQTTMQDYQAQVQSYIQQNYPSATVGDVIGKKEIVRQEYPYLMGTLPYKITQAGSDFAEVPSSYRATITFSIPGVNGETGLSYSTSLPQIAGKKITLSYSPLSENDQKIIESFLPKVHADGSELIPAELLVSLPSYLINLKPELRIDGQVAAEGLPSIMGVDHAFGILLSEPGIGLGNTTYFVKSGEYCAVSVDIGRIAASNMLALKNRLSLTKIKLAEPNMSVLKEDVIGDLLYATIALYFSELDQSDEVSASSLGVLRYRTPSVGLFKLQLKTQAVLGIPLNVSISGMMMDVKRIVQAVFSKDGNLDLVKHYMLTSGIASSRLEGTVPFKTIANSVGEIEGVSAVKALKVANESGSEIVTITERNIQTILSSLQVSNDVVLDITNAVNAGLEVTISKKQITYKSWTGVGYFIIDPDTGAGSYMISGGNNGAAVQVAYMLAYMALMLAYPLYDPVGFVRDISGGAGYGSAGTLLDSAS
jgi:hypothetical protein